MKLLSVVCILLGFAVSQSHAQSYTNEYIENNKHVFPRQYQGGWVCIQSKDDSSHSLWVTLTNEGYVGCAGPKEGLCYWFSDDQCTKLITDSNNVAEACCSFEKGWCKVAHDIMK